ncbi:Nsp1-like C-terminal region-domain-containing protein [Collybia nuda]|uniref:Nucleoporin NSP1 n=1 Tax=Collybia nuda TaxID=64659 RepID=A0A9P6CJN9_9AGAR|nr:Nsp1-like C-terminal region-domain-containing protein [Collybia nuda]
MSSFQSSTPQGGNIFGANNTTASGTMANSTTQSNIFGARPTGGGNLFGATSNTATNAGGSLFGGGVSGPTSGGLFGGGSNTTTPSTNLFGGAAKTNVGPPSVAATTNPAPTNGLFGGTAFSLPKPAEGAAASKPAGSSFFSQPSASSASAGSTPATGAGLFNTSTKLAGVGPTPATGSTPTASSSIFGGGLFAKPPTAPATTTTTSQPTFSLGGNKDATPSTTTAPPVPAAGFFGGLGGNKPVEKKDAATPAAPTTTPGTSFNLFGAPKADEKKDGTSSAPIGGLFGAQPASKDASNSVGGAPPSTALVAVPPPSMLRGKTIEEIVNRWSTELETHVREFNRFAGEVSVWDRALIENGNNLAALYGHVQAAEREQNEIEQSLDHIEQQQKELDSTLAAYEKASQEILGNGSLRGLDTGPADTERDKNYMLATDLHTHLDDLSGSLTQMIDSVNTLSLPSNDMSANGVDPMVQIAQILSGHLESLQWIDGAVREVDSKVTEVEKRVKDSGHGNTGGNGQKSKGFGLRS